MDPSQAPGPPKVTTVTTMDIHRRLNDVLRIADEAGEVAVTRFGKVRWRILPVTDAA